MSLKKDRTFALWLRYIPEFWGQSIGSWLCPRIKLALWLCPRIFPMCYQTAGGLTQYLDWAHSANV